jgi:hypothetical protein
VQFEIPLDGKVVLEAHRLDQGQEPDVVWDYLKGLEFQPEKDFRVPVDPDNPLQATLKGKVRIFARYGGDVTVSTLRLVRDRKELDKWRLDPKEVEKTLKLRKVDPRARVREK